MDYLILIIALGAGVVLGMYMVRPKGEATTPSRTQKTQQDIEKERNVKKVLDLFNEKKDSITNDDVEDGLNVSDATATRYLNELEETGLIRQEGAGRGTYYVKN